MNQYRNDWFAISKGNIDYAKTYMNAGKFLGCTHGGYR